MNNSKGLDKWLQRDVLKKGELELKDAGITLGLQAIDYKTMQNLRKKNVIVTKEGKEIRNEGGFPMDLIATGVKSINGEPFNFYSKEALELLGEKTHEDAINNRFTYLEILELVKAINELSDTSAEAEKDEVDELKN